MQQSQIMVLRLLKWYFIDQSVVTNLFLYSAAESMHFEVFQNAWWLEKNRDIDYYLSVLLYAEWVYWIFLGYWNRNILNQVNIISLAWM